MTTRLQADFNGLFGDILCLSHDDTCKNENGEEVTLCAGMRVTAFEENYEGDERDDLIAIGTVEPSPDWLCRKGSKWCLKIDPGTPRFQSDLK